MRKSLHDWEPILAKSEDELGLRVQDGLPNESCDERECIAGHMKWRGHSRRMPWVKFKCQHTCSGEVRISEPSPKESQPHHMEPVSTSVRKSWFIIPKIWPSACPYGVAAKPLYLFRKRPIAVL